MPPSSRTTDLRALCSRALIAAALAALTAWLAAGATTATAAQPGAGERPVASAAAKARFGPAVLAELNRVRAKRGLGPVVADRRMSRTAAAHSRDMARRGYFAHGAWGGRVARASGARQVGEVIAWLARSRPGREARAVVRGWLRSPSHRHIVLDGRFKRVGVGRAPSRVRGVKAAIYTVDWASAR
ncbi:CAP domain-containing protein [Conexibacter arvalis]|uniref:Uncharacterized protein YkwD n=1 Tax=Conexibacter arvalis TaxID=912552 RepID=A0A840IJT9_9ACTN|nr:CAP domain-containing protein [Conexibacter arvalis]MBB4664989.1 uncharacterized protein YkwD [Conexibacter arvalis]